MKFLSKYNKIHSQKCIYEMTAISLGEMSWDMWFPVPILAKIYEAVWLIYMKCGFVKYNQLGDDIWEESF